MMQAVYNDEVTGESLLHNEAWSCRKVFSMVCPVPSGFGCKKTSHCFADMEALAWSALGDRRR